MNIWVRLFLKKEAENIHISMRTPITQELKIDQSVAHNGVCLTVVNIQDDVYTVTVIQESLLKTNLGHLQIGDKVNIERCMKIGVIAWMVTWCKGAC